MWMNTSTTSTYASRSKHAHSELDPQKDVLSDGSLGPIWRGEYFVPKRTLGAIGPSIEFVPPGSEAEVRTMAFFVPFGWFDSDAISKPVQVVRLLYLHHED